jgi:hemolysin III
MAAEHPAALLSWTGDDPRRRGPVTGPYLLPDGLPRPRLRGLLHLGAFVVALGLGVTLVLVAGRQDGPAFAVYGLAVAGLFGVSALYHRGRWQPAVRARLQRVDHSMIFVLIAGTYTPVCVHVLDGRLGAALLAVVWGGALIGAVLALRPTPTPRGVGVGLYVALGWIGLLAMPSVVDELGWVATALIGLGGLLYTVGAVIYARRRPNPLPAVFGYHEIFHALTIAGAAFHYAVIAFWVLPLAH